MEQQDIKKIVEETVSDKVFVARLEASATVEEAQKVFAEKGIDLTVEELQKIAEDLSGKEELSEADLENVAGGDLFSFTAGCAIALGVLAIIGISLAWKWLNSYAK